MPDAKLSPQLETALVAIRAATAGMTDEQMVWHPDGKWSSSEILEHLALAYARTADRMQALLHQDLPEVRGRTFKEWIGGMIVLRLGRIPPGRKSPEAICPKGISSVQAKSAIEEKLAQVDAMIEECEKRFGSKENILVHTVLGPLSASEWRRFHCVHTLHHMKQIHALREKMRSARISEF
jgi:hypothetical protein